MDDPYLIEHLTKTKAKLNQLKERISLLDACNPTRKQIAKKRLYEKLIKKEEENIKKELRISDLPPMIW